MKLIFNSGYKDSIVIVVIKDAASKLFDITDSTYLLCKRTSSVQNVFQFKSSQLPC